MGKYDELSKTSWIFQLNFLESSIFELYSASLYFTVTTLVTVGYGDIHAFSVQEQYLCILLMILGVLVFSFTTGSLSSMITSYDSREALLKERIATLNAIAREYQLDVETFNRLVKTIKYDHSKKQRDIIHFMEELPHKMRVELSQIMINKMYSHVGFFKGQDSSFIGWVAHLIKSINVEDGEYVYKEGEEIVEGKQIQIYDHL